MKKILPHDWNELASKFQNASPYPLVCIDDFLGAEFAAEIARSYPEFSNAQAIGTEFKTVNEKGKIQITDQNRFPDPVKTLHQQLASEEFIENMVTLSGIKDLSFDDSFGGGGMHMTNQSGILDVHVDFNRSDTLNLYRRLNLLIYLNEEWKDEWGGRLEVWNANVSECVHSFLPKFNRCVIFATSDVSFHGVTEVNSPISKPRKSFAIYLYNNQPASTAFGESHSTIFKARPNEIRKKYIAMPLENCLNQARHGFRRGKRILGKFLRG